MKNNLIFSCKCGDVSGHISNMAQGHGIRFVCYCDDCQVSALVLGHPASLDENGGTSAALLDSSKLVIQKGIDRLAAMRAARIKSRPVLRWYCSTCRTPLFNTYDNASKSFLSFLLANSDSAECDKLVGPSTGYVWGEYATGDLSEKKKASIFTIIKRMFWRQISARISGDYLNTPLFDRHTGLPIAKPQILSDGERKIAEAQIAKQRASK